MKLYKKKITNLKTNLIFSPHTWVVILNPCSLNILQIDETNYQGSSMEKECSLLGEKRMLKQFTEYLLSFGLALCF